MADYIIDNTGFVPADEDFDTLTYNATVGAGVILTGLTGSLALGYSGVFDGTGSNDGVFSGIESFTFNDLIGGSDDITTGDAADTLNLGAGNDSGNGGGGSDRITAGTGSDSISGGSGNDILTVLMDGGLDDTAAGDSGSDILFVSGATTAIVLSGIIGGAGSITGSGTLSFTGIENVNITGSGFSDSLVGSDNSDTLFGGAGNDTLRGGGAADFLVGGTGNDSIVGAGGDDRTSVVMDGTDVVDGGADFDRLEIINTTNGNVSFLLNSGAATHAGGATVSFSGIERIRYIAGAGVTGDDTITGGVNADSINAGLGSDVITGGGGQDSIDGGGGTDRWIADFSAATSNFVMQLGSFYSISGGGFVANVEALTLATGSGNDRIRASNAGGNDIISTGLGDDQVFGLGGNDTIRVGAGLNEVDGGDGNDLIVAGTSKDSLFGGNGNDTLDAGAGTDYVDGGAGLDHWIADTSASSGIVTINLNASIDYYLGTGTLRHIESVDLTLGSGLNLIRLHTTSAMDDTVRGGDGLDIFTVWLGGDDVLRGGGGGNDHLNIFGSDTINGVEIDLTGGTLANGYAGTATDGNDTIVFSGFERFRFAGMGDGADSISTGGGMDRLNGNGGADYLNGGGESDQIDGGAGQDTLVGGSLHDQLYGGADADQFVFSRTADQGRDRINDFADGVDLIVLAGGSMSDVTVRAINDGLSTQITLDSGTVITLVGVVRASISAADFVFG